MSKLHKLFFAPLLLAVLLLPLAPARAGILQTIGDFLSLGANTVREIQEAIGQVDEETRQVLEALEGSLTEMMDQIEETYQDNLNITIDSLDAATRNKLLEVETIIGRVNDQLREDIRLISDEAKAVIAEASLELRQAAGELEQRLENIIIVGGETAAFVLDRAVANGLVVISVVLLGIGALLFVWILFTRKLPGSNFARALAVALMLGYVGVFVSLTFVPPVRLFVMTTTGIGLQQRLETVTTQPRIFEIRPDTLILGTTREIEVWGSSLTPKGVTPTAQIANHSLTLAAASNDLIVLSVSDLTGLTGSTNLTLSYPERDPLTSVVRLFEPTPIPVPPDLQVTSISIDPATPVEDRNTRATVTILNGGGTDARNFSVQWRPFATHPGLTQTVALLAAGQSTSVSFNHAYVQPGAVDSVATVDVFNSVAESNESNNDRVRSFTVQNAPPRQALVRVIFDRISIHDDAETGEGELILNMNVNGQAIRFPSSGTRGMNSGRDITLGSTFEVTLNTTQDLTIFVRGTEDDGGLTGGNDDMGFVSKIFSSSANWGQGSHSDRSNCPDGCYTIHYRVEVQFLN